MVAIFKFGFDCGAVVVFFFFSIVILFFDFGLVFVFFVFSFFCRFVVLGNAGCSRTCK